jgi:hypothetical protein
MDPRRDINVSGNRVVNVADPDQDDHVATKHYVDHLHTYGPDSNVEEYVRYINFRNVTLHSIAGLCKIETDFEWDTDPRRTVEGMAGPFILLESVTTHCIFQIKDQDLKGKSMTVEYNIPVEVRKWNFRFLDYLSYRGGLGDPDEFLYSWYASNDKETWIQRGPVRGVKVIGEIWNGCDALLSFTNTSIGRYKFWKLKIQNGKVTKNPYFNMLLMTVA